MTIVTENDIQNNFEKYFDLVQTGEEIVILRNGIATARLISHDKTVSFLTDSLVGILNNNYDDKEEISMQNLTHL